eukprot:scaffold13357_cov29-Phaeocystis_antarctica.AAC.2
MTRCAAQRPRRDCGFKGARHELSGFGTELAAAPPRCHCGLRSCGAPLGATEPPRPPRPPSRQAAKPRVPGGRSSGWWHHHGAPFSQAAAQSKRHLLARL